MSAKLEIEVLGDVHSLERALAKARGDLAKFKAQAESNMAAVQTSNAATGASFTAMGGKLNKVSGLLKSPMGFFAGGVAASAGVAAIRNVIDAARESQVVLGQTKVAVESVGIAWEQNAQRIDEAAQDIAKAASLDDEAVLQSFQTFVRSQKDVQKAMGLTSLAADVARGRYISLESATQIVNKAAMGQAGALRRLGIQIDKNASSTELLAALQQKYAGAAETYSKSASGSIDRLSKSFEDAKEAIGTALLPAVSELAENLSKTAEVVTVLIGNLGKLDELKIGPIEIPIKFTTEDSGGPFSGSPFGGNVADFFAQPGTSLGAAGSLAQFYAELYKYVTGQAAGGGVADRTDAAAAAWEKRFGAPINLTTPTATTAGRSVFDTKALAVTSLPVGWQNAILKAKNEGDNKSLLKMLVKSRQWYETQLERAQDANDTKAVNTIRSNIGSMQAAITSIYQDRAAAIKADRDLINQQKIESEAAQDQARQDAAAKYRAGLGLQEQRLQLAIDAAAVNEQWTKDDISAWKRLIAFYRQQSKNPKLDESERLAYASRLEQTKAARNQQAETAAADTAKATDRMLDAFTDLVKVGKNIADDLAENLRKQRDKALGVLDLFKDTRENQRDTEDAREALRLAKQIGWAPDIKQAQRDLEDAQLERQRLKLQGATWSTTKPIPGWAAQPGKGGASFTIGTVVLNGIQDVDKFVQELQRRARTSAPQTRGRVPGGQIGGGFLG